MASEPLKATFSSFSQPTKFKQYERYDGSFLFYFCQQSNGVQDGALVVVDSMDQSKGRTGDQKVVDYMKL